MSHYILSCFLSQWLYHFASCKYSNQTYEFHSWHQCILRDICMCICSLYQCMFRRSYMDCCYTRLRLRQTITLLTNETNIYWSTSKHTCHKCDTPTTIAYLIVNLYYFGFALFVLRPVNTLAQLKLS